MSAVPVTVLTWVAAALPIIALLFLMVKLQWGAAQAAPVGLGLAMVVAFALYRADLHLLFFESLKGMWGSVTVLITIWPAILIYEVTHEAEAFNVFRRGLQRISPNELLQVLTFGWVFVSFLQGVTGFGVPVAVGAPLLIGIGVRPLWAVTIALLGHAWANTFGTLSVAWEALVSTTGISGAAAASTAMWAAVFIWVFNITSGITISYWYGKWPAVKKVWPAVVLISLIQGGGQVILTQYNEMLAAFVPASIALAVVFSLGKLKRFHEPWRVENSPVMDREFVDHVDTPREGARELTVHQAFAPYYILIVVTLGVLLFAPIKAFFSRVSVGFPFPQTATGYGFVNAAERMFSPLRPFAHPGMFLLLAALLGYWFFRRHGAVEAGGLGRVMKRTVEKTMPATIGIVLLIVMSRIMSATGQVRVLAEGTAALTGIFYVGLAPMIGILGSFITSSNLASNVLFGQFQQTTAGLLGLSQNAILGAQTAGGAIGNTVCPGNIILGTTTGGVLGKEGVILRMILPITLSVAVVIGVILLGTQLL